MLSRRLRTHRPANITGWSALRIVLVCVVLCAPLVALAQGVKPGKVARIGRLSPLSQTTDAPSMAAFRKGLRDLGWVEGQNFVVENRFADGHPERLPKLAAELVHSGVDLILVGSSPGVTAAKSATTTVPIVMVTTGDPVADRLVVSLAHPEANVTGVTALGEALALKRLELLKEVAPPITRVAVLFNGTSAYSAPF